MTIDIKPHPSSTPQWPSWLAIVTTKKGYCYFLTYAGDQPSEEKVREVWREDRKAFLPYNT